MQTFPPWLSSSSIIYILFSTILFAYFNTFSHTTFFWNLQYLKLFLSDRLVPLLGILFPQIMPNSFWHSVSAKCLLLREAPLRNSTQISQCTSPCFIFLIKLSEIISFIFTMSTSLKEISSMKIGTLSSWMSRLEKFLNKYLLRNPVSLASCSKCSLHSLNFKHL